MKSWLPDNDVEIYSAHAEGKCDVAEQFIKSLKNKIHKHVTAVSKNMYIDLNIYHITTYIAYIIE